MKKTKNFASIVLALVMAIVMMVPVFAANNPFASSVDNGEVAAPVVDTPAVEAPAVETPVVEDLVETPVVEDIGETPEVPDISNNDVHVCPITKANEHRHIVDCDECGNYEYVRHEELEASVTNAFFHSYECVCGYGCSETHHFLYSEYPEGHAQTCVDCGYQKEMVPHTLVDEYSGYYHKIVCLDCRYVVEKHVGTKFQQHDENVCIASCRECGTSCSVAHDFYDFTCDNCGYEVHGYSYGIVEDIREVDNGYSVSFMVNGNSHRITIENAPDFNEGDFVEIDHYGNTIFGITVMVDAGVVDNPEAFSDYIYSDKIKEGTTFTFEDIVIDEIEYDENATHIWYESGRGLGFTADYVVYDLMNGEMSELLEGYAYLRFHAKGRMYFICIW